MTVQLDVKAAVLVLLFIALIVLVVYLIVAVANLIPSLKKLNKILGDAGTVTGIVQEKAVETKPAVDDLSKAVLGFANAAKGNETSIASVSNLAKAVSSLVSIIKNSK